MAHPHFFIAGVGRSGSSSLYQYLREHPQIHMSPIKEPGFFHWDGETHRYEGPIDEKLRRQAVAEWDAYRALFADARDDQISGEATPSYLYDPKVPARIARRCPGAEIFVILRDPAERAFSQYHLMCRSEAEPLSFEAALDAEAERTARNWGPSYHYVAQGHYEAQIRHWRAVLGGDAVHVLFFDDLQSDAKRVTQEVFTRLGVDPTFSPRTERIHNPSYQPRSRRLHQLLHGDDAIKQIAKLVLPQPLRKQIWWRLQTRNRKPIEGMQPDTRRRLVEVYRDGILRLQERVGRDLSSWLEA